MDPFYPPTKPIPFRWLRTPCAAAAPSPEPASNADATGVEDMTSTKERKSRGAFVRTAARGAWLLWPLLAMAPACRTSDAVSSAEDPVNAPDYQPVNPAAGDLVLYEAQVRTANACHPDVGSPAQRAACARKVAPPPVYRVQNGRCPARDELAKIRMGTLDDMLEDTNDFRVGITLRYVREKVGANTLWLMPVFPNNDQWNLPDGCDNLGSPYAVRDYFHVRGTLSRACITAGRDEYATSPCWGNDDFDRLVAQAHARGLKVMLDVALNHFGHNYLTYDVVEHTPIAERIEGGERLDRLWDFEATYEPALVRPEILDTPEKLDALVVRSSKDHALLQSLKARCPSLSGDALVRAFSGYRLGFGFERASFPCGVGGLEYELPGFYVSKNHWDPSRGVEDTYGFWPDVKFLYHHEDNRGHHWEFVRNREYIFRILNYWASRGVDAFRLDHTTDPESGLGSNEWKYLLTKVNFYAQKRGQSRPIYLAEEFHQQEEMNKVVDILTDGFINDIVGRGVRRDSAYVERVVDNMKRFRDRAFVTTGVETHDEGRLVHGTGLDPWSGAALWGLGATTRSTPLIVMGQELGATFNLAFKSSEILHARFEGSVDRGFGEGLVALYSRMTRERLAPENRALRSSKYEFLRTKDGRVEPNLFAQVKWSDDGNVVFVFHNVGDADTQASYSVSEDLSRKLHMADDRSYRLVDVFSGGEFSSCRPSKELRSEIRVAFDRLNRFAWLRLESCR